MKTAIHRGLFKIVFLFLTLYSSAEQPDFPEIIASGFSKILTLAPQEKIYLHTDKPYLYSAGDNIWFRAHLVNAATHRPDTRSNFVYVELIDKADSVITRVKVKRDKAGLAGRISLAPEIAPGEYMLRAYTYWMQNAGSDFFFHKKIYIGNSIDDRVRLNYHFGTPEKGKFPLKVTLTNAFSTPLAQKNIMVHHGSTSRNNLTTKHITNQQGEFNLLVNADSVSGAKKFIEISIDEPGLKLNRKIQVPELNRDFDISFFPESGVFLDNQIQTVGFKAIGSDGLSCNVSGKIYNNKNEEITEFSSFNKGMGKIYLHTFPGESYYAVVTSDSGIEKRVNLPATSSSGIALKIGSNRGTCYFEVLNQTSLPTPRLYIMAHSRGIVYMVSHVNDSQGHFSESFLPPGICSFSILDSLGNVYCERLNFIRNFGFPTINMQSDKTIYGKREPVKLNFTITTPDSLPAQGSFSVSVTDSYLVKPDTINDHILSYLLLSSDIKGYIEEPQQYFLDNSPLTREKTDLLMLTQGWKRFNTPDILKAQYPRPQYYIEAGQSVSGKILNLFNKPVKNSEVIYFSNYKNQITTTVSDSTGQFIIEGIDFPDSTHIILKAKSKSKIVDVELVPDKDIFPVVVNKVPFSREQTEENHEEYFNLSKEKYYIEGGMRMINLAEFTVSAEAKTTSYSESYYSGMADNTIDAASLEKHPGMRILDIISMMPGVMVSGQSVSVRGASQNALFLIDGIETENIEDIDYLTSSDVEEIALFKGPSASIFGLRGGNGVIAITLKKGITLHSVTPASLAHISPLGYQQPVEFYVPKYEVDSILNQPKSDLRTTIYWAPKVQTDEQGKVQLEFFTADKANNYNVELEGVTGKGEICRYKGILRRE
ncbi:MAG: TonB-dependent receptor plug domain-containing protein [Paludibacter sp.]|nr:TonB-dependent receptor plug domain-containing protein [Paludibacter sp.]